MQTVIEILIDFSSSMMNKLALTKNTLLNDIIPFLDYSAKIGIKTFTATTEKEPIIETILPLSITNKEQIVEAINTLSSPNGNTPIAVAIKNSVDSLKEYLAFDKKIILVTDGQENCGGNYTAEVDKAKSDGINCQIHIIGIGLSPEDIAVAVKISTSSNGSFSPIDFSDKIDYNQNNIKKSLTPFYNAVKQSSLKQPIISEQQSTTYNFNNSISENIVPIQTEVKSNKGVQIERNDVNEISSDSNSETLRYIIEEIRYIKNQLNELTKENEKIQDIEEDTILNERIRKVSEEYIFEILKKKYPDRVKWLNESEESYSDHDFEILNFDDTIEYFIECKGTIKTKPTFYLTKNEWRLFLNHTKNYQIYFVKNSFSDPTLIFIDNLMDWILKGKIVPYLKERQVIKEERVFLTLNEF